MAKEIERKFLTSSDRWRENATGTPYRQGYMTGGSDNTVRIRVAGETGYITIKGPTIGISRDEYEYEIPLADADQMLKLCHQPIIDKTRYLLPADKHTWEIDVFHGDNEGLIVAEIELSSEDELFTRPTWLGPEVSGDHRYSNSQLAKHPYSQW